MKKLFLISCLFIFSLVANAQREVTKFLGIPVDGTKTAMIQKLKAKGFTSTAFDREILEGEFNGRRVYVNVVTNNRKVYRIMLTDAVPVNENNIKIRFNNLCQQFMNNPKYSSYTDQSIPDDEKISYEIMVKKKRYEAAFFQVKQSEVDSFLKSKYTEDQIANPTDDIRNALAIFISKKFVWFMIDNTAYDEYKIIMYYDNGYNQANGEDL